MWWFFWIFKHLQPSEYVIFCRYQLPHVLTGLRSQSTCSIAGGLKIHLFSELLYFSLRMLLHVDNNFSTTGKLSLILLVTQHQRGRHRDQRGRHCWMWPVYIHHTQCFVLCALCFVYIPRTGNQTALGKFKLRNKTKVSCTCHIYGGFSPSSPSCLQSIWLNTFHTLNFEAPTYQCKADVPGWIKWCWAVWDLPVLPTIFSCSTLLKTQRCPKRKTTTNYKKTSFPHLPLYHLELGLRGPLLS